MSTDYKSNLYQAGNNKKPSTVIFLMGALVGALVSVPVTIYFHRVFTQATENSTIAIASESIPSKSNADAVINRLTFYDILTANEQIVKDSSTENVAKELSKGRPVTFQLGAFQNSQDADNLQAKLILMGLEPKIESADIPSKGGRWLRVRIGPISDTAELQRIKILLSTNSIQYAEVRKN